MSERPISIGEWDLAVRAISDASSAVVSGLILAEPGRDSAVYELHSIRCTMSEDGTGDLASAAIADAPIAAGLNNADGDLMGIHERSQLAGGGIRDPNTIFHWGRSNQLGSGSGDGTIYLPPSFYWDGEIHGLLQNGAGATVSTLFTIVFRVVVFSANSFNRLRDRILPNTIAKARIDIV